MTVQPYPALLDFDTPRGLRLNVSSLSSPNFATSYTLGSIGVVDGSLSYLYSSLPIKEKSQSGEIELRHVIQGYRQLQELRRPDEAWWWEEWHQGKRVDRRGLSSFISSHRFLVNQMLMARRCATLWPPFPAPLYS